MKLWRRSLWGLLGFWVVACGGDGPPQTDATGGDGSTPAGAAEADREGTASAGGVVWTNLVFDEVLKTAAAENRMILVDVWAGTCHQCEVMDQEIWNTPDGVRIVGDAIAMKLPSDARESYAFRYRYPITGLPAVLLLDSNGEEVNRVVGYRNKTSWMVEASEMMTGIDPLPELEKAATANPEDLDLNTKLMEKYLERAREGDALRLMEHVLQRDPDSATGHGETVVREMARFYAFFRMDSAGAAEYWRKFAERFPHSSGISGALKSTLDEAKANGSVDEWIKWVCGLTEEFDQDGKFNSGVAMFSYRNQLKAPCLAEAARRAHRLGGGAPGIDTVAVHLQGP